MELFVPVALILLGFVLVALEVYVVPGIGVVGIGGGLALVAGIVMAFVHGGVLGGVVAVLAAGAVGAVLGYVMWETGALQRFVLAEELRAASDDEASVARPRARLLGKEGVAVTPLRPSGVCEVEGERVEAHTEGAYIAAGSRVRVVAMDRRRFLVRLADDAMPPTGS